MDAHAALLEDGYVVLPGALPHAAIDAHLAAVEPAIRRAVAREREAQRAPASQSDAAVWVKNPRPLLGQAIAACAGEASQALFYDARVRAFAAECFGAEPVFTHGSSLVFPTGLPATAGHNPHVDYLSAAAPDPWTLGLRFWCALEDIDPDAGPFEAWRGSHRLVAPQTRDAVLRADPVLAADMRRQLDAEGEAGWKPVIGRLHAAALAWVRREVERQALERVRFPLRKGDVVAFNPGIVHGPSPCRDERLTRRAMIYNLVHPDAAWYTPRAYFGPLHDYRAPANRLPVSIERGPHGPRWADYPAAFEAHNNRPVAH